MSRPGLIAGPLHTTPLQINSQSIPRLDPIDSKSSYVLNSGVMRGWGVKSKVPNPVQIRSKTHIQSLNWTGADRYYNPGGHPPTTTHNLNSSPALHYLHIWCQL